MRNKKTIVIILIILFVFGGVYGALKFTTPLSPEEKLADAERRTANLDSYSMNAVVEIEAVGTEKDPKISFSGSGDYDRIKRSFDGKGIVDISMEGLAVSLGGGITYIDGDLFGNITTFPYLALPLTNEQVVTLTENDILIIENLPEKANLFLEDFFNELEIKPMTISELLDKTEKIGQELWKREILFVSEVSADEFRGSSAERYAIEVDGDKMADFYIDLIDRYHVLDLFPGITEDQKEKIVKEIDEELRGSYGEEEMNAWIQDGYFVKLESVSTIEFDDEDIANIEGVQEFPKSLIATTTLEYTNFNEDFNITAPKESMTLEALIEEL